jgi:hypothetical protein
VKVIIEEPILARSHGAGFVSIEETANKQYIVKLSFEDDYEEAWSYPSKYKAQIKFQEVLDSFT